MREAFPQNNTPPESSFEEEQRGKLERWCREDADLATFVGSVRNAHVSSVDIEAAEREFNARRDFGKEGSYSDATVSLDSGRTLNVRRDDRGSLRVTVDMAPGEMVADSVTVNLAREEDGKPVSLDGKNLGMEFRSLPLDSLIQQQREMGADRFNLILLSTVSGNVYALYEDPDNGTLCLAGARENTGSRHGMRGHTLSPHELQGRTLDIGRSFDYGSGHTSSVTCITAVNTLREYDHDALDRMTERRESDAMALFRTFLAGKDLSRTDAS